MDAGEIMLVTFMSLVAAIFLEGSWVEPYIIIRRNYARDDGSLEIPMTPKDRPRAYSSYDYNEDRIEALIWLGVTLIIWGVILGPHLWWLAVIGAGTYVWLRYTLANFNLKRSRRPHKDRPNTGKVSSLFPGVQELAKAEERRQDEWQRQKATLDQIRSAVDNPTRRPSR